MKRLVVVLPLLLLSACATARPAPSPEESAAPARMLASMTRGRLPRLRLREVTLGTTYYTADMVFGGSSPSASGQIPCATGAHAGVWESSATCGLSPGTLIDATGSTSTSWATGGFHMTGGTQTAELQMVDVNTGLLGGWGERLMLLSYHGIVVRGATGGATPAVESGGGSGDTSLAVVGAQSASCGSNSNGGCALRIDKNVSGTITTGTPITFSGAGTIAVSSVTAAASTCTAMGTVTITGAALGAHCETTGTATNGGFDPSCVMVCGVTAANTVAMRCCNVATSSHSVIGTWGVRVWNN